MARRVVAVLIILVLLCQTSSEALSEPVSLLSEDVINSGMDGIFPEHQFGDENVDESPSLKEPKVLVIGLDGVRPDVMMMVAQDSDSALGSLMENGSWSTTSHTGNIAYSGPSWSSFLTGVWCDKHLVLNNSFSLSNYQDFPHFMTRLKQNDSDFKTASLVSWYKLNKYVLGDNNATIIETVDTDSAELDGDYYVKNKTVEVLKDDDEIDAVFAYLGHTDTTGHRFGFSPDIPEYVAAVRTADDLIGEMIEAIEQRTYRNMENWLVIISTDHGGGGENLKSHSPSTEIDRTTFFIVSGEEARKGELTYSPVIADVAVTALFHLGLEIKGEWQMDGQVVGHVRGQTYEEREIPICIENEEPEDNYLWIYITASALIVATVVPFILYYRGEFKQRKGEEIASEDELE